MSQSNYTPIPTEITVPQPFSINNAQSKLAEVEAPITLPSDFQDDKEVYHTPESALRRHVRSGIERMLTIVRNNVGLLMVASAQLFFSSGNFTVKILGSGKVDPDDVHASMPPLQVSSVYLIK